ncbi:MAG: hypothetical protein B1H11_08800 [Desulfobacteraceae bacterium 4484_190.1]|nr:MAG: hypothetical protein B1H11_08800 [Desulfobacteraceae bacterium 4484_190.1]
MKILLDMNLSPSWVPVLKDAGYEVKHWSEIGSFDASDFEIMSWANHNGYTVFTHDLDFGALLYLTNARGPSVVQIRCEDIRPKSSGKFVLEAFEKAGKEIELGALVVVDPRKNRIRLLPLRREE